MPTMTIPSDGVQILLERFGRDAVNAYLEANFPLETIESLNESNAHEWLRNPSELEAWVIEWKGRRLIAGLSDDDSGSTTNALPPMGTLIPLFNRRTAATNTLESRAHRRGLSFLRSKSALGKCLLHGISCGGDGRRRESPRFHPYNRPRARGRPISCSGCAPTAGSQSSSSVSTRQKYQEYAMDNVSIGELPRDRVAERAISGPSISRDNASSADDKDLADTGTGSDFGSSPVTTAGDNAGPPSVRTIRPFTIPIWSILEDNTTHPASFLTQSPVASALERRRLASQFPVVN
ncbi:hypothetical protein CC1G_02643 [Coprinopsis cinerea okayama7|uniref:Uncharacterized protein n=1 Tax=Coprinopsis cinerea (strain Okayama-7 / 130 / ATCC MYA-4618 / FGSC 9003) TaxID=240176 RepID=A8PBG9_COPC7|nr:hypothetical protein CC1G_02643 [Coprinopsis cinerea okayama7\|eukprot:XP_001840180.2 hypothetical protein CC1G_02643 [Coprinopsis cinerea okayama7\